MQVHSQLTLAGKLNASIDEIRQFITPRQCQYEQYLRPMKAQPFGQITNPQPVASKEQQQARHHEHSQQQK